MEGTMSGGRSPRPVGSAVAGLPGRLLGTGYHHSAAHARSRLGFSRRGGILTSLAEALAAQEKDFRVLNQASSMAVAMVVLYRMLPQSENGVLVVMAVERFCACRSEMTW